MSDATATAQPVEEPKVAEEVPAESTGEATTNEPKADDAKVEETKADDTKVDEEAKADSTMLKTTKEIDYDNHRNNRKFDPASREVTDDPVAIRKQVEFYFGDYNFPQDKFMWEQCEGGKNTPIPIEKIHSFKRMRSFQPYNAVVAALRDSTFLDVDGEEGKETVKRKVPYKPMSTHKSKIEAATVYVKGFGDETPSTQFDLETFFAQHGDIKGIKLRRTPENLFKGSVFVTFVDEEAAKKFLSLDPAPKWKDHDLKIMSKQAYCDEKNELIRQGKLEPSTYHGTKKFFEGKAGARGRGRGNGGGPRDRDDWKGRRDNDQKNGFKDRRDGGRGGRGGRGRGGRGGRGRGRGGRDDRRDRDGGEQKKQQQNEGEGFNPNDAAKPRINSSEDANSNGKRARNDDAAAGEPAAKKVDVKADA